MLLANAIEMESDYANVAHANSFIDIFSFGR